MVGPFFSDKAGLARITKQARLIPRQMAQYASHFFKFGFQQFFNLLDRMIC